MADKFLGSKLLGSPVFQALSKNDLAVIAWYLSKRINGDGKELQGIWDEFSALSSNKILRKKKIRIE